MPRLGHTVRTWHEKTRCQACGRGCRAGATHPRDLSDPPASALCLRCLGQILDNPEAFAEAHP